MRLLPVLALLLAGGCVTEPVPPQRGQAGPVVECDGRAFHVVMRKRQATLYLPGLALSLPRRETGNGKRYADGGNELWWKSDGLVFRTPEETHRHCRLSREHNAWADAWLRGVDFRAFGNEPGWILEITAGRNLFLQWDYGERRLRTALPEAIRDGELFVYRPAGTALQRVEILDRRCRDDMKGDVHGYAVRLWVDGRELLGCGRGRVPPAGSG